ncbi:SWF or SNF family helicase [Streptomyces sp. NPDC059398]|uniref:SWIM zinc finger family protein n=1 Tax=Streptomyces sp. NPDC059398 TaxID=3346820 RepID=UPI0036B6E717
MSGTDAPERTFAALAPREGRAFAGTWWGRAWLKALEDTALDGGQLKKGRGYARRGAVGAMTVRPGRITAVVRDPDSARYRSDVLLQQLSDQEWDRFLGMAVESAGHIAALLDREMPPHLVEDAAAAGVELLPGPGDLEPECSCDAWDHCPHTAALGYQVARLLDEDPFVLLLIRGRGERELLDELQRRSAGQAAGQASAGACGEDDEPGGVRADEVFAALATLPPLPAPPPVPDAPGRPPSLETESGPGPGLDPGALEFLAADAARRAAVLLTEALSPGHEHHPLTTELTPQQDAVRLAVAAPDARLVERLAAGSGRSRAGLDMAVRAWRCGGPAALSVLEERWTPDPEGLARARAQLDGAWEQGACPRFEREDNRWTVVGAGAQLRYAPDGRWWPYREERGGWVPAGPADPDPATALALTAEDG